MSGVPKAIRCPYCGNPLAAHVFVTDAGRRVLAWTCLCQGMKEVAERLKCEVR
jgi:uncharacterized OB-fold protein